MFQTAKMRTRFFPRFQILLSALIYFLAPLLVSATEKNDTLEKVDRETHASILNFLDARINNVYEYSNISPNKLAATAFKIGAVKYLTENFWNKKFHSNQKMFFSSAQRKKYSEPIQHLLKLTTGYYKTAPILSTTYPQGLQTIPFEQHVLGFLLEKSDPTEKDPFNDNLGKVIDPQVIKITNSYCQVGEKYAAFAELNEPTKSVECLALGMTYFIENLLDDMANRFAEEVLTLPEVRETFEEELEQQSIKLLQSYKEHRPMLLEASSEVLLAAKHLQPEMIKDGIEQKKVENYFKNLEHKHHRAKQNRAKIRLFSNTTMAAGLILSPILPIPGSIAIFSGATIFTIVQTRILQKSATVFEYKVLFNAPYFTTADFFGRNRQAFRLMQAFSIIQIPMVWVVGGVQAKTQLVNHSLQATQTIGGALSWFQLGNQKFRNELAMAAGAFLYGRSVEINNYRQRNLNPFTDKIFWINTFKDLLSDALMAKFFGNASESLRAFLTGGALSATSSVYVNQMGSDISTIALDEENTEKSLVFDFLWSIGPAPILEMITFGTGTLLENHIPLFKLLPEEALKAVLALIEHSVEETKESGAKLRYIRDQRAFWKAVGTWHEYREDLPLAHLMQIELNPISNNLRKAIKTSFLVEPTFQAGNLTNEFHL